MQTRRKCELREKSEVMGNVKGSRDPSDEAAAERPKEASNTEASTRREQSTAEGDVTLEDVLSSLLALADSSPSHSRLATPCKPPASPVSPDIRHV
ncbi:hypothetical protein HPB47_013137, partial [Ixodes persulcatus]